MHCSKSFIDIFKQEALQTSDFASSIAQIDNCDQTRRACEENEKIENIIDYRQALNKKENEKEDESQKNYIIGTFSLSTLVLIKLIPKLLL